MNNKILYTYTKNTPCKEIFQAVCDEIGAHYETIKGFKYARARPKITFKNKDLKLEISFWSSGYNMPGDYVLLEIIPQIYSVQQLKEKVSKKPLFWNTGFFFHPLVTDNQSLVRFNNIFEPTTESQEPQWGEPLIIDTWRCNVYAINDEKFKKLIDFIGQKIIVWLDRLSSEAGIEELLIFLSKTENGRKSINQIEMDIYLKSKQNQ
jgi:hypothetical protein